MRRLTAAAVALLVFALPVGAQARLDSAQKSFWGQVGLGLGWPGSVSGLLSGSLQRGGGLLTLRVAVAESSAESEVSDVALLAGRSWRDGRTTRSIAAGAAYVDLANTPAGDCAFFCSMPTTHRQTVGLAATSGVDVDLGRGGYGIGFEVFVNLNSLQSFAGAVATFRIGAR